MKENLEGYAKYYQRVLDLGVNGYKTVAGGTGLGKTHGVIECIKGNKSDYKFIYVSHRHNLLEEMANNLRGIGIEYCYLRNDADTIKSILETDKGLERLADLLEDGLFKEYINYTKANARETWKYSQDNCKRLIKKAKQILTIQSKNNNDLLEALDPEDAFQKESSLIFSFFKRIFFELAEINKNLNRRNTETKYSKFGFKAEDRLELLTRHPVIFQLFPYWQFETEEEIPVLLITIQKLFSGFFNGSKNVNIYKLKDKIFFLDEFEFLEPVLLDKIIKESKLDNPFVFIAYFYHNISIKRLDENYLGDYPSVRSQIDEIWKKIDDLKRKSSFPDIRSFGVKDPKVIKSFVGSGLYQANYTSIDQPIYLEIDQNLQRYWLTGSHSSSSPTTFNLMKSIKLITNDILQFYLQLKTDNDKLYSELVEDAYEKTDYVAHLNKLSFFSVMPPRRKNSKRGYRITNFSYLYQRGYVLYVLDKPPTQAEPNEVLLNFFMVNSSPERCLLGLIQKNVVFGLSATATITRYLEHFDLNWIKNELEFEADDSTLFMEIDEEDLSIVKSLTEEKKENRKNFIELSIAGKKCREPFSSIAKQLKEDSKFVSISPNHDYHVERLVLFFNTLDWVIQNPLSEKKREAIDSHIVFFNSLRQFRAFLESEKEFTPNFKVNSKGKHHYNISYFGLSVCVILLDSKAHKYYFNSSESKGEYNSLFSLLHPTILITQYPSANNGVNLQYERKIGTEFILEDYQSIHLLEAPHFYFSSGSSHTENEIKSDIWKLAKLKEAKKISPSDFNKGIKGVINNSNDLNRVYKDSTDYTLNQVAKIIQALGRIERVRDREVGLQRGRISENVLGIFNRYFHNSEIQPIITESLPFFSHFVQLFFSQIENFTKNKRDKNDKERPSKILIEDSMCQGSLSQHVNSIWQIQNGQLSGERARNFIEKWKELRKSALRFDFKSHWIKDCHGTFFSEKIYKNSRISWSPKSGRIYEYNEYNAEEKLLKWDFNMHFRYVSQHEEIRNYFHSQGYELEFIDYLNFQFFTPSFFKQIYLGALGEEASKAMFLSQRSNKGERLFEVLNTEEINLSLFEIVDFVIPKLDWFVDAKFFSEENMTVSYIAQKVKETSTKKIDKIRSINPKAKLVLVNANSIETGHTSYFDKNFYLTQREESDIIVFPSLSQLKDFLEQCQC